MYPLISAIIPTYNYARYLNEAIQSIIQQDYPKDKIEIIVVDDGSTDNTKEVLQQQIQDDIIQYHYQPNQGKAAATVKAIKMATGKYIFNLDADDYFLPNKIKRTVEVFESDDAIVHIGTPAQILNQDENIAKSTEGLPAEILEVKTEGLSLLQFFYQNNILYGGGSTFSARASVLKKIDIPAEVDMYIDEFLILAVLPFGKSFFIQQPLSIWRVHNSNYSGKVEAPAKQSEKARRLLKSSSSVLTYLVQNNFDEMLIKIYTLKHKTREIANKETEKTKSLKDIFQYTKDVFFEVKPGWTIIKKYHVLNRLLPMPVYRFLKKI